VEWWGWWSFYIRRVTCVFGYVKHCVGRILVQGVQDFCRIFQHCSIPTPQTNIVLSCDSGADEPSNSDANIEQTTANIALWTSTTPDGVLPCRLRRWLGWQWVGSARLGSAAVSIDRSCGDLVEWNCYIVSNRQVALNRQVVTNRHRRSEPAASTFSPTSIILGPCVLSQSPDGQHRCLVCHSASSSYGSRSSCNVRLPPVDDIHAVSELVAVSSVELAVAYQQLHTPSTSMLSWYRERQWHVAPGRLCPASQRGIGDTQVMGSSTFWELGHPPSM